MTVDLASMILVITTLGGLATSAVLLYKAKSDKRKIVSETHKISADAAAVISSSAIALMAPMEAQINDLESRLKSATRRAEMLDKKLADTTRRLEVTTSDLREATKQLNAAHDRIDELESQLEIRIAQVKKENGV